MRERIEVVARELPERFATSELWLVDLAATHAALAALDAATPRLGPDDDAKIAAIAAASVRAERRSAYIALRLLIERAFGAQWRGVAYARSPAGKPSLASAPGAFSLSHVPGAALIGLTATGPIGVDLERPRPVRVSDARRARIEAAAEVVAPGAPLPQAPERRFTQAWVRLEAVAKAEGCGIGRILERFAVSGPGRQGKPSSSSPAAAASLAVHDLALDGDICAAVALAAGAPAPPVLQLPGDLAVLELLVAVR